MANFNLKRLAKNILGIGCVLTLYSTQAFASTTGNLPFNSALDNFKTNFYAWIFVALVLLWAATCLMLAFGEWKDSVVKLLNFVFWGALACSGPTLALAIFNVGAVF